MVHIEHEGVRKNINASILAIQEKSCLRFFMRSKNMKNTLPNHPYMYFKNSDL